MPEAALIVYRNCSLGGVSSVIMDRVALLQKLDYEVHCIFQTDAGGSSAFEALGVKVHIFSTDFDVRLERLISHENFALGVLLSHFHLYELLQHRDIRSIAEFHGSWLPDIKEMKKFPLPGTFIVPGEWSKNLLASHGVVKSEDIVVCPNRVRWTGDLAADRSDTKRVIWVGRIGEEHKNWRDGLSIFAAIGRRMAARGMPVRFSFVFSLLKQEIHLVEFLQAANSAGINDIEILYNLDPTTFDELFPRWGRENSVFLSTSKGETFGLAAAQALVAGIPSVICRGGAVEAVFGDFPDEACSLFDRGQWLEAADCVGAMLENGPAGRETFETIRSRFSEQAAVADIRFEQAVAR